jgi:hypothetical protein
MSNSALSLAFATDLPGVEKSVLVALADYADDDKGETCWPSIAQLVKKCGWSERAVQKSILSLEQAGHITRLVKPGRGVIYTVHPRTTCTPAPRAPAQDSAKTPAPRAPKPLRTPILEKEDSIRPTDNGARSDVPDAAFEAVRKAAWLVGRSDADRKILADWIGQGLDVDEDIIPTIRDCLVDRDDTTSSLNRFTAAISKRLAKRSISNQPKAKPPALADVGDGADGYRKALPESLRRGLLQDCEIRLEGGALVHIPRTGFAAEELKTTHRADLARAARQSGFEPAAIIIRDIAPRAALAR